MAERLSVFIMGLGRMGDILAGSMARNHLVAVYDADQDRGRQAARRIGVRFCLPGDFLPEADVLVLALPPVVTVSALGSVSRLLQPGTVVINIATTVSKEDLRPVLAGEGHLAGVKIVGHYREMKERPAIIADADTEKALQAAVLLFSDLGSVVPGDEGLVRLINTVATREAFRAAVRIEDALRRDGVTPDLIGSALRVVAAGSVKSYAEGDIGPFARDLIREIKSDPGE